jgi:hypothetical protein
VEDLGTLAQEHKCFPSQSSFHSGEVTTEERLDVLMWTEVVKKGSHFGCACWLLRTVEVLMKDENRLE